MNDRRRLTYEQAWTSMSEIAKACREFNELQFKYRQFAITLILAAYAAIGFFMTSPDPAIKATLDARAAQDVNAAKAPAAAKSGTPPAAQAQPAPPEEPKASPTHVRRVSLLLFGIGLLATVATFLIWLVDTRVYHRLLQANFIAALEFEDELKRSGKSRFRWPPFIHSPMNASLSVGPVIWISTFYLLGAIAGLVPWYIYVDQNGNVTGQWMTDMTLVYRVLGAVLAVGAALWGMVLWSTVTEKGPRPPSGLAHPAPEAAPAAVPNADRHLALVTAARSARSNAYAPYSEFAVGASVLAVNDDALQVFSGCNVENAAYGSTLCAERNAIAAAVAAGFRDIREIVVYTEGAIPTMPCGACRQVMHELARNATIHLASSDGVLRSLTMPQLLPEPFGPESLKEI